MRHIRIHRPQPLTVRLDTALAGLLARNGHGLYRASLFPEDARCPALHKSNRSSYRRLVSHLPADRATADLSLILVVVGWFIVKGPSETRGEVVLGRFGKNTLSSFPVQVFAYT